MYRVVRGSAAPLYLVDLPGYGYARGGADAAETFEALTQDYFGRGRAAALLLVDARHPGLGSDQQAWQWLRTVVPRCGIVATKIDKLARGERIRAMKQFESVFETSVLPVSAATGEGLDELWKTIERLANNPEGTGAQRPQPRRRKK